LPPSRPGFSPWSAIHGQGTLRRVPIPPSAPAQPTEGALPGGSSSPGMPYQRPAGQFPPVTGASRHPTSPAIEGDTAWVPAGQIVQVGGYAIRGGFVYVGRWLPDEKRGKPDPALIDPGLPVDPQAPDYTGASMGYWPSYSAIAPGSRAAYLHWLAHGRRAPSAYIGYVFLYFYGLERRLLVDGQWSAAARAERAALVREVRRLLGIYGTNGSFRGYAENLLRYVSLAEGGRRYLSPPPGQQEGWELPFELRVGLGELAADAQPVPAAWALSWLRLHPKAWLRTPATRCPDEFNEIFTGRYQERFGSGMVLERGGPFLQTSYRPASSGIASRDLPAGRQIPDVADAEYPFQNLRELAEGVCLELDGYSRYLGRHPDAAGSAAAWALLPPGLERPANAATQALVNWARQHLGDSATVTVAAADLSARWSAASGGNGAGKSDAELLARALERFGIGMDPDVRFGGPTLAAQAHVVLFRRGADIANKPSAEYTAAATLAELGAAVALADGRLGDAGRHLIERRVLARPGLGDDEGRRLRAHFTRVLEDPPTLAALRKHISLLPRALQLEAGELLVALARADGSIDRAEVSRVNRLLDALGLDRPQFNSQPNTAVQADLTCLRTAGEPERGHIIPQPPTLETPGTGQVVLDPELIRTRLAESERAADLLAGIFTGEDTSSFPSLGTSPGPAAPQDEGGTAAGLDASHRAFLAGLADRPTWRRSELDDVAAELGLLPDGALAIVNEAAFEAVGEPVWEGTDPIEVDSHVLKEMLG